MKDFPESLRRLLRVSSSRPEDAAWEFLRRFARFQAADPTGAAADVSGWVPRYRIAAEQRHAAFMANWGSAAHDQALVELHFFLTAACRIVAYMKMAADRIGGDVKTHVDSRDFAALKQARDHFEHIEDRLHGGGRSRLRPITEGGNTRTVHFALRAADQHFTFGDKAVDVSATFLTDFLSFVDRFQALVQVTINAATPIPQNKPT